MGVRIDMPRSLPTLAPDARDGSAATGAYVDAAVARTKAGKGPGGGSLGTHKSGPKKGRPITLQETGQMLADWTEQVQGDARVERVNGSPQSGILAERFGWMNPDRDLDRAVTEALDDAVTRRIGEEQ